MYEESGVIRTIAEDVIHTVEDLKFLSRVSIAYLECDKKKMKDGHAVYGECIKVTEMYRAVCYCDFIIVIYTQNCKNCKGGFSYDKLKILVEHELRHIGFDGDKKLYIVPHDVVIGEFEAIRQKYGADWSSG